MDDEFKKTHDIPLPLEISRFYKHELTRDVVPISYHKWNALPKLHVVDAQADENDFCLKCGDLYMWLCTKGGQNNVAMFSDDAGDISKGGSIAAAVFKCLYWLFGHGVYIFRIAMKPRKFKRLFMHFADYVTVDEYNEDLGYTEKVYYVLTTRRNYLIGEKLIQHLEHGGALNEFIPGNERTDAEGLNEKP